MAREWDLSGVLSEFARTMVTDFPIQAILDRLVERIVEVLPITGAGVTLISATAPHPRYVAASGAAALRFEKLQTQFDEGPCLEAHRTGEPIVVADLALDDRFPLFGPRARAEGLAAVFTFPLLHDASRLGALDLYRDRPGVLDPATMEAAQTLADVAAAYLLNAQARADLQALSERARDSSLHDALTGLPNRVLVIERLGHAVARGHRSGKMLAVLFADLDRFKAVNDVHGHQVGDELLVAVGRRMSGVLRPGDTLGRMSGDEFVILCEDLDDPSEAEGIAARIGAALRVPFVLSGVEILVTASVGIAFSGHGDHLPEQLLHRADTAMYQAKRNGGGRHEILDLRDHEAGRPTSLSYDLGGALSRKELGLVYQPIVTAVDGRVIGVEALLRWAHPARGMIPPSEFIPLAEQSGLITGIGRWVLDQACQDRGRWIDAATAVPPRTCINVSVHQLMAPAFASTVASILADTSTDPDAVTLEMTESGLIQDGERALVVLAHLKDLGVSLALDDFGTGYSSLSHLQRFPIDVVKIDHSFMTRMTTDPTSCAIVSAVIDLSHALGKTVVAEGVETVEQHRKLIDLGCDWCQGFYFARPMTSLALETAVGSAPC